MQCGKGKVVKVTGIANQGRTATVLLRSTCNLTPLHCCAAASLGLIAVRQGQGVEGHGHRQPGPHRHRAAAHLILC
jgi:hypothetical protein